jgi:hypothetical protein
MIRKMNSSDLKKPSIALFKRCNLCDIEWDSRDSFISDPNIEIIGYQANFKKLTTGYFYFNHSCKSTLAIPASEFIDLYDGPIFIGRATNTEECLGYCLDKGDLRSCPIECECACIREIIQIIKCWEKN